MGGSCLKIPSFSKCLLNHGVCCVQMVHSRPLEEEVVASSWQLILAGARSTVLEKALSSVVLSLSLDQFVFLQITGEIIVTNVAVYSGVNVCR